MALLLNVSFWYKKLQWWEVFSVCISSSTELWKKWEPTKLNIKSETFYTNFWLESNCFLPDSKGWSTFERNYHTVAPNIVIISGEKEVIRKAYISKHCLKLEYKATMMISNKEKDCT